MMDEANKTMISDTLFPPAQAATYGGAGVAVAAQAWGLPEWVSAVSLIVTLLGFTLQAYVQIHRLRREARYDRERDREQAEHAALTREATSRLATEHAALALVQRARRAEDEATG